MTTTVTDFLVGRGELGRTRFATSPLSAAKDGEILKAAANPRGMQGYAAGR